MQHLINRSTRSLVLGTLALSACALDPLDPAPGATSTERAALGVGAGVRVQAGERLVALGVTDDDHALYWGDGAVWATALGRGARPRLVARAAAAPLTMVVGRVALIWTDQPVLGALGPSALTVWTSAGGAHLASAASWPPALSSISASAAVSPDGRQLVFTSNVSADGATGDIVRATTDLGEVTTLVAGAQVHPFGPCAPHVGFDRDGDGDGRWRCHADREDERGAPRRRPGNAVVAACAGSAPTGTLSRWVGDRRSDLTTSLLAGIWWSSDADGDRIYSLLASGASAVWDRAGHATVIETRPNLGWMSRDGSITAKVRTSATTAELHRTSAGNVTHKVMELPASLGFMFANHVAPGIPFYNLTAAPTSRDGEVIGAWSTLDPSTGLTDAVLIDVAAGTLRTVHAAADALPSNELTTRDSSHELFYVLDARGGNALFAAARDGRVRQISEASTDLEHYGLTGSVIAFSDHATGDPADLLSTTDIELVDVASAAPAREVARGAHQLYFPTADRRSLVYSTEGERGPGLYVVRVR